MFERILNKELMGFRITRAMYFEKGEQMPRRYAFHVRAPNRESLGVVVERKVINTLLENGEGDNAVMALVIGMAMITFETKYEVSYFGEE